MLLSDNIPSEFITNAELSKHKFIVNPTLPSSKSFLNNLYYLAFILSLITHDHVKLDNLAPVIVAAKYFMPIF
jgi:hypothetical protein